MKRGPKPSNGNVHSGKGHQGQPKLIKSTYLLDENMKQHVAVIALVKGVGQADIVRDAITRYLKSMNCDISKPPKLPRYEFEVEAA